MSSNSVIPMNLSSVCRKHPILHFNESKFTPQFSVLPFSEISCYTRRNSHLSENHPCMDQSNVHQLIQFIYHFSAEINTDQKEIEHSQKKKKNLTLFILNILFSPRKIKVLLDVFSKAGRGGGCG